MLSLHVVALPQVHASVELAQRLPGQHLEHEPDDLRRTDAAAVAGDDGADGNRIGVANLIIGVGLRLKCLCINP